MKTVDQVLSTFTRALTQLEQVRKQHLVRAEKSEVQSNRLADSAKTDREEAIRATNVATKLEALLS